MAQLNETINYPPDVKNSLGDAWTCLWQTLPEGYESPLRQRLKQEFKDPDTRYAYAESSLNTRLASQIKVLREQRGLTQAELADLCGTKQAGLSRFEDVNHAVWKTDTLWKVARALGVRVHVSFETFGNLLDEKERFSREHLERPTFENDPAFSESGKELAERLQYWVPLSKVGALSVETNAAFLDALLSTQPAATEQAQIPDNVIPIDRNKQRTTDSEVLPAVPINAQSIEANFGASAQPKSITRAKRKHGRRQKRAA